MSVTHAERDVTQVSRLLAGAAKTIQTVRYCWLVTAAEHGFANARPMGRLLNDPDEDEWTLRFVTNGRSHKAAELRCSSKVALTFQHDPSDAYVALDGTARLCTDASELGRRWKPAYDAYFPSELDRANAMFVEVEVERMELWIRGVTPEPFGMKATRLERDAGGSWRLASEVLTAA
jgi:general stress protein 26